MKARMNATDKKLLDHLDWHVSYTIDCVVKDKKIDSRLHARTSLHGALMAMKSAGLISFDEQHAIYDAISDMF